MDKKYMQRAIDLAKKGAGYTNPNPLVGAVIVKDHKIIGEGYHAKYGSHHAEVNAFLNATEDVTGADMYVTLEPCSHYGKTPPCVDKIIENKIKRVYIGMKDPNPLVAGRGINKLIDHGIEVESGIYEDEVKKLNDIFIKYITTKLPYVILKTAMTLDGKIATSTGDSKWISNEQSRQYVHEIRHRVSAIMVGINTVLTDDPSLTTRLEEKQGVNPVRIIVDSTCRIPLESKVLNLTSKAHTIIATTDKADKQKINQLKEKGTRIVTTHSKNGKVDLNNLMEQLGEMNIDSILLEGGGTLNYSALEAGIVDKVISFIAPKIIGGTGQTPVSGQGKDYIKDAIQLKNIEIQKFGEDIMIEGTIK